MIRIRYIFFASIALMAGLLRAVFAHAAEMPNVLMIMSDDHAAYVTGAYGNPLARTPNIDRLAKTGVKFTNAFVNCPMCTPSRQSLLTGRLPHSIEVTQLRTPLPADARTLSKVMKDHGYRTGAIGKMHFNSNLAHGFDVRLDRAQHRAYLQDKPPRPVPQEIETLPQWRPFNDHARVWLNGMFVPYPAYDQDMPSTWFSQQARQFMYEQPEDQPFFLIVSFYEPHSPFHFPLEYRDSYDPNQFELPEVRPEDNRQIPEIFRDLTDDEKRNIIASYYASTEFLDANIGRTLDALRDSGHADNTLVIYLGDHGYSLGHHGRFEKHTHYDVSVRAPLIVSTPDMQHFDAEAHALVEFIDLFPTVLEYCGIEIPNEAEGISLMPIIRNPETEPGRDYVFSEYYDNEEAMIRSREYKFIYTTGRREREDGYRTGLPLPGRTKMLFCLRFDPDETINLANDPIYADLIAEMEQEMLRRFTETHPEAGNLPPGLPVEDRLDFFLLHRAEPTTLTGG